MPRFQIEVKSSGHVFGVYEGDSEDEAVEALARDAGYTSYRAMCAITDPKDLDAEVERQRRDLIVTGVD